MDMLGLYYAKGVDAMVAAQAAKKQKAAAAALGAAKPVLHPEYGYAHSMVHGVVFPPFETRLFWGCGYTGRNRLFLLKNEHVRHFRIFLIEMSGFFFQLFENRCPKRPKWAQGRPRPPK